MNTRTYSKVLGFSLMLAVSCSDNAAPEPTTDNTQPSSIGFRTNRVLVFEDNFNGPTSPFSPGVRLNSVVLQGGNMSIGTDAHLYNYAYLQRDFTTATDHELVVTYRELKGRGLKLVWGDLNRVDDFRGNILQVQANAGTSQLISDRQGPTSMSDFEGTFAPLAYGQEIKLTIRQVSNKLYLFVGSTLVAQHTVEEPLNSGFVEIWAAGGPETEISVDQFSQLRLTK